MSLARSVAAAGGAVILAAALTACGGEQAEAKFADAAAVKAGDGGKASWVPQWIPSDAKDIRVKFDLDSNQSILRFQNAQPLADPACTKATNSGSPAMKADWWPDRIPTGTAYVCADGPETHRTKMNVVVSGSTAYVWNHS